MQDAMAVFTCQAIYHSALAGRHGGFINKTPIPLVELERLLTGDRIMGVTIPCDQSELGEIPNDESVGCGSHEAIMHHAGGIFKRCGRGGAPIGLLYRSSPTKSGTSGSKKAANLHKTSKDGFSTPRSI
nr:hypothetical protein [Pseudoduganella ginsengisoli]